MVSNEIMRNSDDLLNENFSLSHQPHDNMRKGADQATYCQNVRNGADHATYIPPR